jgi:hypothetical protein
MPQGATTSRPKRCQPRAWMRSFATPAPGQAAIPTGQQIDRLRRRPLSGLGQITFAVPALGTFFAPDQACDVT